MIDNISAPLTAINHIHKCNKMIRNILDCNGIIGIRRSRTGTFGFQEA